MKYTSSPVFKLNRNELIKTGRVLLGDWTSEMLDQFEDSIRSLQTLTGTAVVQRGRVIAIRATDDSRLFSAFKSATYLGKYDDMQNVDRFLTKMVKAHHSYEPIRGESILFLFVGVGKPVYDHLITYGTGRYTRIAGGQRANLPWGLEVPVETKDKTSYVQRNWQRILDVINVVGKGEETPEIKEQIQAARSELPVGYIMPPFLFEFSEEALIKNVFRQRLFEKGAQGATVDVTNDMYECCLAIDKEKWETLSDYHGTHTVAWEKAMRTLRDKEFTYKDIVKRYATQNGNVDDSIPLYEVIMNTVGKLPKSMWDK